MITWSGWNDWHGQPFIARWFYFLPSKVQDPIGIGQGMQGKKGKLGIGRCTKDFDFSIKGCPPDEETIYAELKRYITG